MGRAQEQFNGFDFKVGRILARKYKVVRKIGQGWEGEVYLLREIDTGIDRAAKIFYPERNPNNQTLKRYARTLHKLNDCSIVIRYYTQETITFRGKPIKFLVSDYIEGQQLGEFLLSQPGKKLPPFQAVHLLYALVKGIEQIHQAYQYHGDLHTDNIIVQKSGLGFDLKIIDFFRWHYYPLKANKQDDLIDMVKVFYETLGGQKNYARQPRAVKKIAMGLKRSLILKKFKNAKGLRRYLETMHWE